MKSSPYKTSFWACIPFFFVFGVFELHSQPHKPSWDNLQQLLKLQPKPIVIYMHTANCSYCVLLEYKTLKNPQIDTLLQEHFYFLELPENCAKNITLGQTSFNSQAKVSGYGTHELVRSLNPKNIFPSLIILNKELEVLLVIQSYIRPLEFEKILQQVLGSNN